MMQPIVALDLETTGLNPQRDAIIEIGALRFRGDRIEEEWHSLINPGRPIPPEVVHLTGIDDDMVSQAPRITEVLKALETFVGDDPVLGHNVGFDLGFLRRRGVLPHNYALDTYDLASVLIPDADRYSLSGLASALGIPSDAHRALEDARTTHHVYVRLCDMVRQLPRSLIEEIVRLGEHIDWGAGWVFEELLDEILEEDGDERGTSEAPPILFPPFTEDTRPLEPHAKIEPLEVEELAAILEPHGAFAQAFPEYEHRPQQVTMLEAVAQALSESRHLLVEAGTGTGKSMAYLIPALAWAEKNGERVVISTNTINLQDQLVHKDIPDLKHALGRDYRVAVLKGRSNYICPRHLSTLANLGPRNAEEMRVLAKILVWLHNGGSGDRGEISLRGPEFRIWSRLASDSDNCSLDNCLLHTAGACPYYKAHKLAESAHVLIINHALLLADIATGNRVIPEYRYLIVDEAHHLEAATTNGLSFEVTGPEVERAFKDLNASRGSLLSRIEALIQESLPPESAASFEPYLARIHSRAEECQELSVRLFETIAGFLTRQREGRPPGPYGQQFRIVGATRTLPDWAEIEIIWDDLRKPLTTIVEALQTISEGLIEFNESGLDGVGDLSVAARLATRNLQEYLQNLDHMIFDADSATIFWANVSSVDERLSLHAAPLEVGPMVQQHLWYEKDSIVMTSATLTTAEGFDYIRRRLSAEDAEELALGSPFDFENSTLLYLINDIPEPQDRRNYQHMLERGMLELYRATGGRALALFTSYDQLRRTARAIGPELQASGIELFVQGGGASRHSLLDAFRNAEQGVLLGTRSFWEGIDVPGEALSVLAIARLPFDVPSDPVVAARAETFEYPFDQYMVPEAILRFRQGFGRLIRTQYDRGVVVSFDRRLISKQYGRAFVDSLPRCTVRVGSMDKLPQEAARWLGI